MTAELWSTTPPTEDGWYWYRRDLDSDAGFAFHAKGFWFWADVTWSKFDGLFGPRIPTAEELVSMRETLELFRRELMEKAKEKGGF